jgi:hypothetical protein
LLRKQTLIIQEVGGSRDVKYDMSWLNMGRGFIIGGEISGNFRIEGLM